VAESRRGGRRPGWSTDAQEIVDRVFVYGTLRAGQAPRSMIANHVIDAAPATRRGRIVAFPDAGYPGFIPEDQAVVQGEVVFLRDLAAAFALLDAYEGDEFQRVMRKAILDNGTEVWCWVYELADPEAAAAGQPIASGDWTEWLRAAG
jgi:gamma-glutamylcyclotransferase (GGCT)/AIG2-like uncharacterized protein YtfP